MFVRRCAQVGAIAAAVLALSGCMSTKSFVDPSVPKMAYEDLQKRPSPAVMALDTEFQRNGEPLPRVTPTFRAHVERVLAKSGLISPAGDIANGDVLKVVINNTGDQKAAAAQGIKTGMTFGAAGTTVPDGYEMTVTVTRKGKAVAQSVVKHTLYTAIGNTTLPEGVTPVSTSEGFGQIVEQMLLRSLKDLQKSGKISWQITPMPDEAQHARIG